MAQDRIYDIDVNVSTPTLPAAGSPASSSDVIHLSYLQANYSGKPVVTGSMASPTDVVAASGIPFAGVSRDFFHTWYVQSSTSGEADLASSPQIAAGTVVGQRLRLVGCDDTKTVKLEDGTGLKLSAPSRVLSKYSAIDLEWDGSNWVEVAWNNI